LSDRTFAIGDKAKELMTSVFDMTTSRNHYPVKFKRLSDKLQECALNIHSCATDANGIVANSPSRKDRKYDLQTSVVSNCDKLMSYIEYSLHAKLISGATCEKWTGLVKDIKFMTLSWRSKNI